MSQYLVHPNDDGIRPKGPPDACFYCEQRVGEPHQDDCVILQRAVLYLVSREGRAIGWWQKMEPAAWSADECRFARNESSWCANNIWCFGEFFAITEARPVAPDDEAPCLCGTITFEPIGCDDTVVQHVRVTDRDGRKWVVAVEGDT